MKAEEKLATARSFITGRKNEEKRRSEVGQEIKERMETLEESIMQADSKATDKDRRKLLKERDALVKDRKKMGQRIKEFKEDLENLILGKGRFDESQLNLPAGE